MIYTQTIEIPADRRIVIEAPREIPAGATAQYRIVWDYPAQSGQTEIPPDAPLKSDAEIVHEMWSSLPTLEECLEDARKKTEERLRTGIDPLEKFRGSKIFGDGTDGLTYQRKMRAEWDREWDNE